MKDSLIESNSLKDIDFSNVLSNDSFNKESYLILSEIIKICKFHRLVLNSK